MKRKNIVATILALLITTQLSFAGIPLAGNYTINSGQPLSSTNFPSFNAFADSINLNGISASIVVTVAVGSGPYSEQVVFNNMTGAGPSSTITLDGNNEAIGAISNTTNRHVVRLTNMQYFTITNLNVVRDVASTSGFYGIHIFGTGNYINLINCSVDMTGTNSTLVGAFIASGSETSILVTGDFHNISIVSCTSTGGGYGASVFGLLANLATNILISENNFYDFHSNGVYLRESNGAVVSNNNFDKSNTNVTSVNAIQVAQAANINTQIFNNRIRVGQISNGTVTFRGIYLFNGTGHKVYNNVIHDINLISGNVTGIEVRTSATAPEIYFNTISIDNVSATTGNLYGIKEELSNTNSILRNNLISISQPTSGTKACIGLGATSTVTSALSSNNNDFWVPGGNVAVKGSLTPIIYPTLNNWQSASNQDMNSITINPSFLSVAVPQPTNFSMDNAGTSIPGITTDITGTLRGSVPDIGAYEFNTVGFADDENDWPIQIFPNPGNGVFTFNGLHESRGSLKIEIIDLLGKVLYSKRCDGSNCAIDIRYLKSGIYASKVTIDAKVFTSKIILQK